MVPFLPYMPASLRDRGTWQRYLNLLSPRFFLVLLGLILHSMRCVSLGLVRLGIFFFFSRDVDIFPRLSSDIRCSHPPSALEGLAYDRRFASCQERRRVPFPPCEQNDTPWAELPKRGSTLNNRPRLVANDRRTFYQPPIIDQSIFLFAFLV